VERNKGIKKGKVGMVGVESIYLLQGNIKFLFDTIATDGGV
jgi:hypothetical protein